MASIAPVPKDVDYEEIKSMIEAWSVFFADANGRSALANAKLAIIMRTGPCMFLTVVD